MKTRVLQILVMFFVLLGAHAVAQIPVWNGNGTAGTLSLQYTTSRTAQTSPYQPKHVTTAWISTTSGVVLKTIIYYARTRASSLGAWVSTGQTPDVVSGATLTSFRTFKLTWDGKDKNGKLVDDGTYTIHLELSDVNNPSLSSRFTVDFTKGPVAQTLNPANVQSFSAMTFKWTPSSTTIVPSVSIVASATTVCQGTSVTFTASGTNGGASPAYQWKKNGLNVGSNIATYSDATLANGDSIICVMTSSDANASPKTASSNALKMNITPLVVPSVSISTPDVMPCPGARVTFTASPTNGGTPSYQWSVNGAPVASGTATFSSNTLASGDQVTCDMTSTATCVSAQTVTSNKLIVALSAMVDPLVTISTSSTSLCQGKPAMFTAIATNGGVPTFSWGKNGITVGAGGTSYVDSTLANGDVISCVMSGTLSCASSQTVTSNSLVMTVTPSVVPLVTISTPDTSVCKGARVLFTAVAVHGGSPSFSWMKNALVVGDHSATFQDSSVLDGDVITCQMTTSEACAVSPTATSAAIVMRVQPLVSPSVSVVASSTNVCAGAVVSFTATAVDAGLQPRYQWKKNAQDVGTNSASFRDSVFSSSDEVWCELTGSGACMSPGLAVSNKVIITSGASLTPSVSVTASASRICQGATVDFTATGSGAGTSPSFQWKKNGVNVGQNAAVYSDNSLVHGDMVSCTLSSSSACASPKVVSSDPLTISVDNAVVPSLAITTASLTICPATPTTFTTLLTDGGLQPTFSWKINGVNAGTDTSTFVVSSLVDNDVISCEMTSSLACANPAKIMSNSIVIKVNNLVVPTVSISTPDTNICSSEVVTFVATASGYGTLASYTWLKNGVVVGDNAPVYTDNALLDNDVLACRLAGNASCMSAPTALSNSLAMKVISSVTPSVSISTTTDTICEGTPVTFSALASNAGTPIYRWLKNGTVVGGNADTFTDSLVADNDVIACQVSSSMACASVATVSSQPIVMSVSARTSPTITISATQTSLCAGTRVTFTAMSTGGGSAPSYQWKRSGVNRGTNSTTYSPQGPQVGDVVVCVLTSNAPCVTTNTVTSNAITLVNAQITPSVSIVVSDTVVCAGSSASFVATPVNGGRTPSFQWSKNGKNVGTNVGSYIDNTLQDGDSISCVMTSNATCLTAPSAVSNTVVVNVAPLLNPSVSIATTATTACEGTQVTFTATPVNGGSPVFMWMKNGSIVGSNVARYTDSTLRNNDAIVCQMTSNAFCASRAVVRSDTITMVVNSRVVPSVSVSTDNTSVCSGSRVTFSARAIAEGSTPVYRWKMNGISVGSNSATYVSDSVHNGDSLWCELTSSLACTLFPVVVSGVLHMNVMPTLTPSVRVDPSQTEVCAGSSATFTATVLHGGPNPSYIWKKNGQTVAINQNPYVDASLVSSDIIACEVSTTDACASLPSASSAGTSITVLPVLDPSVNISATASVVCQGTLVSFSATSLNGGSPSFQWMKNNMAVGSNIPVYSDSLLANGDQVSCKLSTTYRCVSRPSVESSPMVITVNARVTPVVTITTSNTTVCHGTVTRFVASELNGGIPSYQWQKNGLAVGDNDATYTDSTLLTNDVIRCVMTSSSACVSSRVAVSGTIMMSVEPIDTPAVVIQATQNNICAGTPVLFSATTTGAGTPAFQWFKNGAIVGSNSIQYSDKTLQNNDVISCKITISGRCVSASSVFSNQIFMNVLSDSSPSLSIISSSDSVCQGVPVTFTATSSGASNPSFEWYKNSVHVGTNALTFTDSSIAHNDVVTCFMIGSTSCNPRVVVRSNTITTSVFQSSTPQVYISASNTSICQGTRVDFWAATSNAGYPVYQWYKNGVLVGSNLQTYSDSSLASSDRVSCHIITSRVCASSASAVSNEIAVTVAPRLTPTISIESAHTRLCAGSFATFVASVAHCGVATYQWRKNGNLVGQNTYSYLDSLPVDNDIITCDVTSSETCVTRSSATSNAISLEISPKVTPSIIISTSTNALYRADSVTFLSVVFNADSASFQWMKNGYNVGDNAPVFTDYGIANGDVVSCVVTTTDRCATSPQATSNRITISVNPIEIKTDIHDLSASVGSFIELNFKASPYTSSYIWQVDSGAGFVDLSTSFRFTGIHRNVLGINRVPKEFDGYKFRCIITSGLFADTSAIATLHVTPTGASTVEPRGHTFVVPSFASDVIIIITDDYRAGQSCLIVDAAGHTIDSTPLEGKQTVVQVAHYPPGTYYVFFQGSSSPGISFVKK